MKSYLIGLILLFIGSFSVYSCTKSAPESQKQQVSISAPEWSFNKTIYEVNIRQYSQEGTFKALENDLPRLKDLGVGILWLMPIHPIGEVNRKGTLGSYYSVKDYYDVNPEFGTKEDFRSLVQTAHAMGFYVILDWVANHTAWDNPVAMSNPEFFEKNEAGEFIPPRGTDWDDVIQLDYNNDATWDYMIDALKYWVEEFNIDGYRCDVADMVPTPFWNRARAELDQIKPVFMLAEAENPEHHFHAFDMSYSWRMHHLFNKVAQGDESPSVIFDYISEDRSRFPSGAFRMNFTSNHDENSWNGTVFERMGDAVEVFAVLSGTMEGMPLIYNGQEAGMSKRLEFFEKDPIDWADHRLFHIYSKLNWLKATNEALFNGSKGGEMHMIDSDNEFLFAFYREMNNQKVITILNLGPENITIQMEHPTLSGTYTNLFTNEVEELAGSVQINLSGWDYKVLYH